MIKVFIIGSSGTTGLRLRSRLSNRDDVELVNIEKNLRKDRKEIKRLVELSDYAFLCLPDIAAKEVVEYCYDCDTKLIDTSTAHRTDGDWAYGFPELSDEHRQKIADTKRVASPGCHASGFVSIVYPLIKEGVINSDCPLSCTSITGYSGGGKKMIAEYENEDNGSNPQSPMMYAMRQNHKHLPEIVSQCGLSVVPIFMPIVGDFYSGMLVSVPLQKSQINGNYTVKEIRSILMDYYKDSKLVSVAFDDPTSLYSNSLSGMDNMEIFVSGNDDRIVISSRFDNLGKGASGAAIQCFNIMCGLPEETGLKINP